jgi:hypothetical protein
VAFLRFSRDKRGYEHFYLVEPASNRRGKVKPRVLYWFRTPPGVRVGREPFDASVRRALEAQNPGISFDWASIVATPIPSADTDKWRDRRRAERAARQTGASSSSEDEDSDSADTADVSPDVPSSSDAGVLPSPDTINATGQVVATPRAPEDAARKRRRRRRSGGRPLDARDSGTSEAATPAADADPAEPEPPADAERSDD